MHPITSALLAFFVYGTWSGYCNRDYGNDVLLTAFFVQGLFAFTATLTLTVVANTLFRKCGQNTRAVIISFLVCFILLATIPATLHWTLHTPNIFVSIFPGLILGNLYLAGFLFLLQKRNKQ